MKLLIRLDTSKTINQNPGNIFLIMRNYAILKGETGMKKRDEKAKFELRFYSGYKESESLKSILIGDREFKVEKVFWRRRVYDQKSGKTYEEFKCRINGDTVKISVYDSGEWSITYLD